MNSIGKPVTPNPDSAQWAVGLMTGTAIDGNIDVALLECNGESIISFGQYTLGRYHTDTIDMLHECQQLALQWQFKGPEPALFAQTETRITSEQSHAILQLLDDCSLQPFNVRVVGFHGQTVLHQAPAQGLPGKTRQLGDGALMAQQLGIDVVNDFRSADMRAGGQGAPLSAIYHRALLAQLDAVGDIAVLNLGGVANLSWWDGADTLLAFDTGPANGPINDFVRQRGHGEYDKDGQLAAQGVVDENQLAALLQHPYLQAPNPKSLDRFDFSAHMAQQCNLVDGAALLTAFSAAAVNCALDLLPRRPQRLIVCGGGRHNPALMQALRQRTSAQVEPAESVGWRGDAIEAECFAYLAMRTLRGLPNSFPSTTGVSVPQCGGVVHRCGRYARSIFASPFE